MGENSSELRDAVRSLTDADLALAFTHLVADELREVGQLLSVRVDPRHGVKPRLARAKLRTLTPDARVELAALLSAPAVDLMRSLLGPDRFADPTAADFHDVLGPVVGGFGARLTAVLLHWLVEEGGDVAVAVAEVLDGLDLEAVEPAHIAPGAIDVARQAALEADRPLVEPPRAPAPAPPPPKPPPAAPAPPEAVPEPPAVTAGPDPEVPSPQHAEPERAETVSAPDRVESPPEPSPSAPATIAERVLLADHEAAESADAARLFSPLDAVVVRTIVATHNHEVGAPSSEELLELVDEFVRLNAGRAASLFHVGFLSVLDPGTPLPPVAALNHDRRQWLHFGRLTGLVRVGDEAALALALAGPGAGPEAMEVLVDERMGWELTGPAVRAAVVDHPEVAAAVLEQRGAAFSGMQEALTAVYERARRLLGEGRTAEAERLFTCLRPYAERNLFRAGGDGRGHDLVTDLRRRQSACRRAAGDFAGARDLVAAIDEGPLGAADRALLAAERGLIEARIGHLGHATFPDSDDQAVQLTQRLGAGRPHFEEAVALDENESRASFCLGLLAFCEDDLTRAAPLLERAASRMRNDPLYEHRGVAAAARFHQALCALASLQPGFDGPAYKEMADALEAGYGAPARSLRLAAEHLQALGSHHTVPFLRLVLDRRPAARRALVDVAARVAGSGAPGSAALALDLAGDAVEGFSPRFDLLAAVVTGGAHEGARAEVGQAAERIDDVLAEAVSPELDSRWERMLAENELLRDVLGAVDAELTRIQLLDRNGRVGEARDIAVRLFHRAAAGDLRTPAGGAGPGEAYDPEDLLDLLAHLGASREEVTRLRNGLAARTTGVDAPPADLAREALGWAKVEVLFVGGNEKQEAYEHAVTTAIANRFGDAVEIRWRFPGWSSNWLSVAEAVESEYDHGKVLVLMAFVRTNLGRRLRRTAGEAGVPWVPCTGHGRAAIERAIVRAVDVVVQQRLRAKGQG